MNLPPLPWTVKGARIYAADGEEIAVATKASPKHRDSAEATAAALVAGLNLAHASLARKVAFDLRFPEGHGGAISPAADARIAVALKNERDALDALVRVWTEFPPQ